MRPDWPLLRAAGLGTAGAGLTAAALAAAPTPVSEPSDAAKCLQPAAAAEAGPEFPFEQYKSNVGGRVKVAVTFPGGFFGPTVEVLEQAGDGAFVDAVRKHFRKLSAPCLQPGASATLRYDFEFSPDQRKVLWDGPRDGDAAERRKAIACLAHPSGKPSPAYPMEALRQGMQGRVHAVLAFTAADQPPAVELHHRRGARPLASEIDAWVREMRMPCLTLPSVKVSLTYVFRLEGEAYGFKALTLPQLLGATKGIRETPLVLDTTEMGCPFDLKFTYLQPSRPNQVGEIGERDLRRRPLLDWLAGVQFELSPGSLDSIYADTADLAVPCVRVNLTPKEKTS